MRRTLTAIATAALVAGLAVPAAARPAQAGPPDTDGSIVDTAIAVNAATGEFSQLIGAVVALDLVDALDGRRQFTVFAPTDDAFFALYDAVGVDDLDGLVGALGIDAVRDVVLYHVVPGDRLSGQVLDASSMPTLNGQKLPVDAEALTVAGAPLNLDLLDVDVDNGVIHGIDAVMLPELG